MKKAKRHGQVASRTRPGNAFCIRLASNLEGLFMHASKLASPSLSLRACIGHGKSCTEIARTTCYPGTPVVRHPCRFVQTCPRDSKFGTSPSITIYRRPAKFGVTSMHATPSTMSPTTCDPGQLWVRPFCRFAVRCPGGPKFGTSPSNALLRRVCKFGVTSMHARGETEGRRCQANNMVTATLMRPIAGACIL